MVSHLPKSSQLWKGFGDAIGSKELEDWKVKRRMKFEQVEASTENTTTPYFQRILGNWNSQRILEGI